MTARLLILDSEPRRERALLIVSKLALPPTWSVIIEEYHPKRSQQQNRRYWLIVNMIAKHVGHDPDEIHEMMKEKFLGTRVIEISGERATVSPSTRKLKTAAFNEYMDKVEAWAIEKLGLWLEGGL